MNRVPTLGNVASFLFYITLQLGVSQFVVLFHTAFCFVYVAFFLLFTWKQEGLSLFLLLSFFVGLFVDLFYNSLGIHAFATVLMVYSRAFLLKLMLPTSSYKTTLRPTLGNLGWKRFSFFSLVLIGIHHTALFLLEIGHPLLFFVTVCKIVASTLLTYVAVLSIQIVLLLVSRKNHAFF